MPTASLSPAYRQQLIDESPTLQRERRAQQFIEMARHAQGRSFADWPGWSTGETVIVALILNRHDVLHALRFTMVEALDRNDLFSLTELRYMAREVAA